MQTLKALCVVLLAYNDAHNRSGQGKDKGVEPYDAGQDKVLVADADDKERAVGCTGAARRDGRAGSAVASP
jgi:hypothetical protein